MSAHVCADPSTRQVAVVDSEAYVFDEEVLKKAADLGKPGLVEVKQVQDKFIFRVEGTGALPVSMALVGWASCRHQCQGGGWGRCQFSGCCLQSHGQLCGAGAFLGGRGK